MIFTDKNTFFNNIKSFEIKHFTQTEGWHSMNAMNHAEHILFALDKTALPTIGCIIHVKKMFGIKMALIEGECFLKQNEISFKNMGAFYKEFTCKDFDIIEINSNIPYSFEYETVMRQAGFLRPVGMFSMPVTNLLDLTQQVRYNQNWKRNIAKANENNLQFEVISNERLSHKDCEDFHSVYNDMMNRKNLSFHYNTEQIYTLCKSENFQLFFVSQNNVRQTAIIIHKHLSHAGLLYAASTENALKLSASFYMYENLFRYLTQEGYTSFDMEKLVPSTSAVNNVFIFKNGVKGTNLQYNGEWSWYKKGIYRPTMYFIKKYWMKKREL